LRGPNWVARPVVLWAHIEALRNFSGSSDLGFDPDRFDGALQRPQNAYHYREPKPDIIELAAIYVHAICKAHAFAHANKRTAFYVCRVFLGDNGYSFDPPMIDAHHFLLKVADDTTTGITEADVAAWVRKYAKPNPVR
jgi:death-on-curing protein